MKKTLIAILLIIALTSSKKGYFVIVRTLSITEKYTERELTYLKTGLKDTLIFENRYYKQLRIKK